MPLSDRALAVLDEAGRDSARRGRPRLRVADRKAAQPPSHGEPSPGSSRSAPCRYGSAPAFATGPPSARRRRARSASSPWPMSTTTARVRLPPQRPVRAPQDAHAAVGRLPGCHHLSTGLRLRGPPHAHRPRRCGTSCDTTLFASNPGHAPTLGNGLDRRFPQRGGSLSLLKAHTVADTRVTHITGLLNTPRLHLAAATSTVPANYLYLLEVHGRAGRSASNGSPAIPNNGKRAAQTACRQQPRLTRSGDGPTRASDRSRPQETQRDATTAADPG